LAFVIAGSRKRKRVMALTELIRIGVIVSIFLIVFALGLHADLREATSLFRRPALLFKSILSMNVIMVIFAAAITSLLQLSPALKIAIITLAVSPVPPFLPGKQMKAGGSASYSISLLFAAVLLSIIVVPVSIEILGRYFGVAAHVSAVRIIPIVLITAILPLLCGIAISKIAPQFASRIRKATSTFAMILLVISVLPILFAMAGTIWSLFGNGTMLVLALFTMVGLAVGHLLGGPEPDDRTVLAFATSARHPGTALAIAVQNFPEHKAEVMAVIICHLVIGALVSLPYMAWRKRSHTPTDAPIER